MVLPLSWQQDYTRNRNLANMYANRIGQGTHRAQRGQRVGSWADLFGRLGNDLVSGYLAGRQNRAADDLYKQGLAFQTDRANELAQLDPASPEFRQFARSNILDPRNTPEMRNYLQSELQYGRSLIPSGDDALGYAKLAENRRQFDATQAWRDAQLAENQRQFGLTHGLAETKQGEDVRQFDETQQQELDVLNKKLGFEAGQQSQRLGHETQMQDTRLGQDQAQFDATMGFNRDKFNEDIRQFAATHNLDANKFAEAIRQYNQTYGLDRDKFDEGQRQFDAAQAQDQAQFDVTQAYRDSQLAENQRQFGATQAQDQAQFDATLGFKGDQLAENVRQFDLSQGQDQAQFDATQAFKDAQLAQNQAQFDASQAQQQGQFDATQDLNLQKLQQAQDQFLQGQQHDIYMADKEAAYANLARLDEFEFKQAESDANRLFQQNQAQDERDFKRSQAAIDRGLEIADREDTQRHAMTLADRQASNKAFLDELAANRDKKKFSLVGGDDAVAAGVPEALAFDANGQPQFFNVNTVTGEIKPYTQSQEKKTKFEMEQEAARAPYEVVGAKAQSVTGFSGIVNDLGDISVMLDEGTGGLFSPFVTGRYLGDLNPSTSARDLTARLAALGSKVTEVVRQDQEARDVGQKGVFTDADAKRLQESVANLDPEAQSKDQLTETVNELITRFNNSIKNSLVQKHDGKLYAFGVRRQDYDLTGKTPEEAYGILNAKASTSKFANTFNAVDEPFIMNALKDALGTKTTTTTADDGFSIQIERE